MTAPANPLRGISIDSACTASVLEQTPGPVLPQAVTDVVLEALATVKAPAGLA